MIDSKVFLNIGCSYVKHNINGSRITGYRRFRAFFGVDPIVCSIVWEQLKNDRPPRSKPKHLMWALMFLKIYTTENVFRGIVGVDEKTWRKWIWIFIDLMASLKVVMEI